MRDRQVRSFGGQAAEDLTFIRSTIERSSRFRAIPGAGAVVVGMIALIAASVSARQSTPDRWLATWLAAAALATTIGLLAMTRKAHRAGLALSGASARKFAFGMAAPWIAGAAITYELWAVRDFAAMAPVWLLLYGVGALTGGLFSVTVVRSMGFCFMAAGIAAILMPPQWGTVWLAIGFGGLHIGSGIYIARKLGG